MTYGTDVPAASYLIDGKALIAPVLAAVMFALLAYVGGRIHQFYRQGMERDGAFRDGYDTATKSLFSLATRAKVAQAPPPPPERRETLTMPAIAPAVVQSAPVPVPPRSTGRHAASKGESTFQKTQPLTAWEKAKDRAA